MKREWLISGALAIVGVVHLLPLLGVVGAARLEQLYGMRIEDPNLLLLMRHRALLFGLLGAFLVAAAFHPFWQGPALLIAWGSVLGFVLLAPTGLNAPLHRVWQIDLALLLLLAVGSWARVMPGRP